MNKFQRVQQWQTFARQWWLYDCKWQDPFDSGHLIAGYLQGKYKPVYHTDPEKDYGDVVVCINTKEISMPVGEWRWRMYDHHSVYRRGQTWASAWDLHQRDPTIIMYKAVYKALSSTDDYGKKRSEMARCYLYPDENIPPHIKENISDQIRQVNPILKKLEDFDSKKSKSFPKIIDYHEDFTVNSKT